MGKIDQKIICGDNIKVLQNYPDNYFHSIVTDAPYGLSKEPNVTKMLQAWITDGFLEVGGSGFMGKKWDSFVPQPLFWKEIYRVLKPGGHVLCFFGTRTYDWGVMAMRISGFEIRDQMQWIYGSGFPKNMDISKKIESSFKEQYSGYGTALKPANEPIVIARKPIEKGLTIVQNIIKYGTGAININDCRIQFLNEVDYNSAKWGRGTNIVGGNYVGAIKSSGKLNINANSIGRWPSNVIFDEYAAEVLDSQTGFLKSGKPSGIKKGISKNAFGNYGPIDVTGYGYRGGASRFFYCAKASRNERSMGLENFEKKKRDLILESGHAGTDNGFNRGADKLANHHPTVKPIKLMQYLVRLVTPKGGIILDPFNGSGTTTIACKLEQINCVGIDIDIEYCNIAEARLKAFNVEQINEQAELKFD